MNASTKTLFTILYKGALSGVGFVTSALLARTLSKPDRLEFQLAGTYVQTGMTFVGGFTNYYAYVLPKHPEETKQAVQMGNLLVFTLSFLVWAVTLVLGWLQPGFLHLSRIWFWSLMAMPLTFMFGYGSRILQAIDEISWLNRVNIAQPLLFTLLVVPLFLEQNHLHEETRLHATYGVWIASFILAVAGTMWLAWHRLRTSGVSLPRYWRQHWLGTLNYGGLSSISQVVNYANYRMDFWLVSSFLPSDTASLYGIAVAASEVLLNISQSIGSVVFRRMTSNNHADAVYITELSARQTIISSAMAAVVMYAVFPWLIPLAYSHKYSGSVIPFFILLPGLIFKASSNIVIQYATNSIGKPVHSIWMNGISAIINAICCVILLPTLGLVGGALASTLSYVLSYVVYVIWFARVAKVSPTGLFMIRKTDLLPYVQLLSGMWRKVARRG